MNLHSINFRNMELQRDYLYARRRWAGYRWRLWGQTIQYNTADEGENGHWSTYQPYEGEAEEWLRTHRSEMNA